MISHQHQLSHLCHTRTPDQSPASTASLADHTRIHYHQSDLSQVCTNTSFQKLARQTLETTFGSFTAVLSHSAGSTAATGANFPHLATSYDISVRSLAPQRSQVVQIAGQNLQELLHETGTWRTRSASNGGTRRVAARDFMHYFGVFVWGLGFGESEQENHSFSTRGGEGGVLRLECTCTIIRAYG
jgi:hypothetical protein